MYAETSDFWKLYWEVFNIHGMVCSVVLVGVVTWVVLSFRYVKREENEMGPNLSVQ
jgi:Na+/pantothenate symporter